MKDIELQVNTKLHCYCTIYDNAIQLFSELSNTLSTKYIDSVYTESAIEEIQHHVNTFCYESKLDLTIDVYSNEPKLILVGRTVKDQIILESLQSKLQQNDQ